MKIGLLFQTFRRVFIQFSSPFVAEAEIDKFPHWAETTSDGSGAMFPANFGGSQLSRSERVHWKNRLSGLRAQGEKTHPGLLEFFFSKATSLIRELPWL